MVHLKTINNTVKLIKVKRILISLSFSKVPHLVRYTLFPMYVCVITVYMNDKLGLNLTPTNPFTWHHTGTGLNIIFSKRAVKAMLTHVR